MTLNELAVIPLTSTVVAFVLTLVGGGVTYLLRPRVRLLWAQANLFSHRMQPNTDKEFLINTASYIVANRGRAPAEGVEFVLNFKVDEISIWPQRQYKIRSNPEGRQIIVFPTLAPKEIATVNLISIGKPLPGVLNLRNANNTGKLIDIYPQQRFPRFYYITLWFLVAFGFFFVVREIIAFVLLLINLVYAQ